MRPLPPSKRGSCQPFTAFAEARGIARQRELHHHLVPFEPANCRRQKYRSPAPEIERREGVWSSALKTVERRKSHCGTSPGAG
jgi:hypothetical protein